MINCINKTCNLFMCIFYLKLLFTINYRYFIITFYGASRQLRMLYTKSILGFLYDTNGLKAVLLKFSVSKFKSI